MQWFWRKKCLSLVSHRYSRKRRCYDILFEKWKKKINSFGFSMSQDGIKYFPHLYIKGCRRVSFSSLLPFQVNKKKNKYKFIQSSMVVFVLCSVSHIYIFQVILCVMEKGEWDCWLGVECSLHFSHFSFYCSYLMCNI